MSRTLSSGARLWKLRATLVLVGLCGSGLGVAVAETAMIPTDAART